MGFSYFIDRIPLPLQRLQKNNPKPETWDREPRNPAATQGLARVLLTSPAPVPTLPCWIEPWAGVDRWTRWFYKLPLRLLSGVDSSKKTSLGVYVGRRFLERETCRRAYDGFRASVQRGHGLLPGQQPVIPQHGGLLSSGRKPANKGSVVMRVCHSNPSKPRPLKPQAPSLISNIPHAAPDRKKVKATGYKPP